MLSLVPYTPDRQPDWDAFVRRSKNGVFLFLRDYMGYHADRFADSSLLSSTAAGLRRCCRPTRPVTNGCPTGG